MSTTPKTQAQITADRAATSKIAKKANSAATARKRPSKGVKMSPEDQARVDAALGDDAAKAEPPSTPGAFTALAGQLAPSANTEQAEQDAIAAIAKAKAPKTSEPKGPRGLPTERFVFVRYNGRAGAMQAFITRFCLLQDQLGGSVCREDLVTSVVAKSAHESLATRAHALDYFAWAARHGLLAVAKDQAVPTPVPQGEPVKAAKKSRKSAKAKA